MRLYYETRQDDKNRLREIVATEFKGKPIDIIIDDASHQYSPTKTSFETLFPYLRPGGLYIIEDWRAFLLLMGLEGVNVTEAEAAIHRLILEIVCLSVAAPNVAPDIEINKWFVVIKRGEENLDPHTFKLSNYVTDDYNPTIAKSK